MRDYKPLPPSAECESRVLFIVMYIVTIVGVIGLLALIDHLQWVN